MDKIIAPEKRWSNFDAALDREWNENDDLSLVRIVSSFVPVHSAADRKWFPAYVQWDKVGEELNRSPLSCCGHYAELCLTFSKDEDGDSLEIMVPDEQGEKEHPTSPLPFAIRPAAKIDVPGRKKKSSIFDHQLDVEKVAVEKVAVQGLKGGDSMSCSHLSRLSLNEESVCMSAMEDAFLDMMGSKLDLDSILLQSRYDGLE